MLEIEYILLFYDRIGLVALWFRYINFRWSANVLFDVL